MEVGPLARLVVAYAAGKEPQKTAVDNVLKALDLPASALFSTLGRTAARGIETQLSLNGRSSFFDQLMKNLENGDSRMANPVMWENENCGNRRKGSGLCRSSARRTGSFRRHREQPDEELSDGSPDHLERFAERRERQPVTLRISLDRHTDTRCQSTA